MLFDEVPQGVYEILNATGYNYAINLHMPDYIVGIDNANIQPLWKVSIIIGSDMFNIIFDLPFTHCYFEPAQVHNDRCSVSKICQIYKEIFKELTNV